MIKVGITGGIGSGKTSIAKLFELLKVHVYYSDAEAKRLMLENKALKQDLIDLLGTSIYEASGALNRAYMAQKIFSDRFLLKKVNALVHPAVEADFMEFCEKHKTEKYVLKEAAILMETGLFKALDKIILVTSNEELKIERVVQRDGSKREEVLSKMKQQWSDEEKKKWADFIIENNQDALIIPQVLQLHQKFNS